MSLPRAAHFLNRATNQTLYHYTDLGGLNGIISKHDLWLTNCRFSNDGREISYGFGVADQILQDRIAANAQHQDFLKEVRKLLEAAVLNSVYVCCFCDKDNLLSQWRGYGANGTGVSIEIVGKEFSKGTGDEMPQALGVLRAWIVYYKEEQQQELLTAAIDFGLHAYPIPTRRWRKGRA